MKNSIDLTTGSIYKKLVMFGTPIFFSLILQAFYNIVDMLVVGRFIGSAGTAAIGNVSSVIWVVNAIGAGIAVGGAVLVSQYTGARDKKSQKDTISTLFGITAILSIFITILSILTYKYLFVIMDVPIEAMEYASDYMFVICTGWIFMFGYNSVCSVMKGLGDSKCPLYFMILATILNIVLDIIFVGPLNMGPKGAAVSTVIAECVSFVLSLIFLKRLYFKDEKIKFFALKKEKLLLLLKIGLPTMGQMVIVNISFLFINSMLNVYGVVVASAAGTGMKILNLMTTPCWAIGQTVCTMVGQSMGSGNIERTRDIGKIGVKVNFLVNLLIVLIFQVFAGQLISLFDTNPDVISQGVLFIRVCCSLDCIMYAIMFTYDMFAVGTGDSKLGFYNSFIDSIFMRIIVCWILGFVFNFGFIGIYAGVAISSIIPAIIGAIYFKKGIWEKKQKKFVREAVSANKVD
ncbi:MAG: Multidrug resistance protein NorM [Eubacteriales bacterium SKADARSKE-1]|nr:Multidrug resistance protein NorM [Eubacteriales bacterium SKADARSKE-1]